MKTILCAMKTILCALILSGTLLCSIAEPQPRCWYVYETVCDVFGCRLEPRVVCR